MAGNKNSGRKSKLTEWAYQDSVLESDARYLEASTALKKQIALQGLPWVLENEPWRKLFYKLLEIGKDYVLKAMPSKVVSEDQSGNTIPLVVYLPEVDK